MDEIDQKMLHFLSIKLNDELFAIEVYKVLEVLQKQHITHVPNVPDFVKGVINFRGEILPVIEGRQKFSMPSREEGQKTVIIVLDLKRENRQLTLGVIADGVKDVLEISESEIKDVPEMGSSYNTEFLRGMVQLEKGFLMLLNVDRIFSTEEIVMINEAQIK